jgi:hypothetical protein
VEPATFWLILDFRVCFCCIFYCRTLHASTLCLFGEEVGRKRYTVGEWSVLFFVDCCKGLIPCLLHAPPPSFFFTLIKISLVLAFPTTPPVYLYHNFAAAAPAPASGPFFFDRCYYLFQMFSPKSAGLYHSRATSRLL